MMKTKIQKVLAFIALASLAFGNAHATQIGTGSVTGTGAFDSVINWNDTFTANSASGTVSGVVITATVDPTLNMTISTGSIDLGSLAAGIASNGSLTIEIGTNAANGVSITARSGSGGLTNTSDNAIQINDEVTDGLAESYTWTSTAAAPDSTAAGFASTGDLGSIEVNDDTTEHVIYTTNKPEPSVANDDVTFTVSATAEAATPAGAYQDTVTFTVVGNF